MALPAGRYGVTKNQLLKIKKLPMNTIKLIEELIEKFDLLGSAAFKNSTSVVTQSTDLVESGAVYDALAEKADNSVIGTVEDGTTASQAYAVGEHFIRNGKFCTVTVAVTTSSTWTLGSNYVEGDVADLLNVVEGTITVTDSSTFVLNYVKKIHNIVCVAVKKEISYTAGEGAILLGTLPNGFIPNQEFYTVFTDPNGEYMGRIAINTLGRIFAKPSVTLTNKTIGFTVTYII